MLYDGQQVLEPYLDFVQSLIETEFHISKTYIFFDGEIQREGITYILGVNGGVKGNQLAAA